MARQTDLQFMVGKDENILWQGKPDFKCFILECIFAKGFLGTVLIVIFECFFIPIWFKALNLSFTPFFTFENIVAIVFVIIASCPVLYQILDIVLCVRKYQNTEYIITDKGVYISGGVFSYSFEMKSFMDMAHVDIHRGILDQILKVGDVVIQCNFETMNASGTYGYITPVIMRKNAVNPFRKSFAICDIPDYRDVFYLVKNLQENVYSDIMFPNDLRPEANHGYRTGYAGNPGENPGQDRME